MRLSTRCPTLMLNSIVMPVREEQTRQFANAQAAPDQSLAKVSAYICLPAQNSHASSDKLSNYATMADMTGSQQQSICCGFVNRGGREAHHTCPNQPTEQTRRWSNTRQGPWASEHMIVQWQGPVQGTTAWNAPITAHWCRLLGRCP
jgi:hypothetical protein